MKITGKDNVDLTLQKSDKSKVKIGDEKTTRTAGDATSQGDQVTLSEAAKEIGKLSAEAMKLPDVRTDKVEELKNAINSGTYNVKGDAVAGKILKDTIVEKLI